MSKIADLIGKVVNTKRKLRLDPREIDDTANEPQVYDLITPYWKDTEVKDFRPQLVAACVEIKGLESCLTFKDYEKVNQVKIRHLIKELLSDGIDYNSLSESKKKEAFERKFGVKRIGL